MIIPSDTEVKVIIVENDSENYSEKLISDFSLKSRFRIEYFLETTQGLVFARNRSVREAGNCDFCCFTDDDEVVTKEWLTELIRCQKEFDADGVAGPTYPVFTKELPDYLKNFHMPKIYNYGTVIESAFTGSLLLRKIFLDKISGPFDEKLNFTGGEDINLTYFISKMGGVIRYNPSAIAYETFLENRETIKYVIKRTYRNSNTGLYARSLRNTKNFKLKTITRLIMRFCNGLLIIIPFFLFGGKDKLKGVIKIVNAIGGFHFIIGRQNQFYK
jgi:GT2 family glycosyltransferase